VAGLTACGTPHHTPTQPTITVPAPRPPKKNTSLPWPTYGADNLRTRAVTVPGLRPPFRKLWTYFGRHLLELPPVAGYGLLYEESFDGRIHAIYPNGPKAGQVKWSYYGRRCGWSSPALGNGLLYATFIGSVDADCSKLHNGGIVAIDARTGKVRWARNIAQSESSPLFSHGIVYFGTTDGRVHAWNAKTGTERWNYNTGGPVKGSPALKNGRIFIGNYDTGNFFALNARTGAVIWEKGGHGNFYAGPSVVDGRVYVGNNDHRVYAFSARTGDELWHFSTGNYVYASPAVWRGIVLVGSYDHNFYAINGATGSERWSFPAGGPISGAASVIDGVVYFSTLSPHRTYALDAATGHVIRTWNDGEYSPAIAAYGRLFLIGEGRIYALAPR
jgi:outer membrane protein assembly factor BamB